MQRPLDLAVAYPSGLDRDDDSGRIAQETRAARLQKGLLHGPDFEKGRELRRAVEHPQPGCFFLGQDSPGNLARLKRLEVDTDRQGRKGKRGQIAACRNRAERSRMRTQHRRASLSSSL